MTEQSEPKPLSAADFLAEVKARHPDLDFEPKSPGEMVSYIRSRYLKPNWTHWVNMAEVSLERAVWLSLDIEPWDEGSGVDEAIGGISKRPPYWMQQWYSVQLRDSLRHDYELRWAQCWAAINAGSAGRLRYRRVNDFMGRLIGCFVSLSDFRRWGESLPAPWTFPDEFPGATAVAPKIPELLTPPPPSGTPTESSTSLGFYAGGTTWVDAEYDERLKEAMTSPPDDEEPDTKTRKTYLRTIRALAIMAKLIDDNGQVETGAAGKVARRVETLGFNTPKERTIRDLLSEAARLNPGE